jgi:hypothetical protein
MADKLSAEKQLRACVARVDPPATTERRHPAKLLSRTSALIRGTGRDSRLCRRGAVTGSLSTLDQERRVVPVAQGHDAFGPAVYGNVTENCRPSAVDRFWICSLLGAFTEIQVWLINANWRAPVPWP